MFFILNGISFFISFIADILNQIFVWISTIPGIILGFISTHFPILIQLSGISIGIVIVIFGIKLALALLSSILHPVPNFELAIDLEVYDNLKLVNGWYKHDKTLQNINGSKGSVNSSYKAVEYYTPENILKNHTPKHPVKTFLFTNGRYEFGWKPFFGLLGLIMTIAYTMRWATLIVLLCDAAKICGTITW